MSCSELRSVALLCTPDAPHWGPRARLGTILSQKHLVTWRKVVRSRHRWTRDRWLIASELSPDPVAGLHVCVLEPGAGPTARRALSCHRNPRADRRSGTDRA